MKLFLGWSGDVSRRAADAFRSWIPNVLQTVEPFMSEEDIAIGARWSHQLDQELEESSFGVTFVTPSNFDKPWILFEAGALSKSIADSKVSPVLIGIDRATLTGPLTHFQSALPVKPDIKRLVASINEATGDVRLDDERLDKVFNTWWGELEPTLSSLVEEAAEPSQTKGRRPDNEIIAETLELVRSLQRTVSDPSILLPPEYVAEVMSPHTRRSVPVGIINDLELGRKMLRDAVDAAPRGQEPWIDLLQEAYRRLNDPIRYLTSTEYARTRNRRIKTVLDDE